MRKSLLTALAVPLLLSCAPSGQEEPLEASEAGQRSLEHATDVITACIPEGRELFRAAGGVGGSASAESSDAALRAMEQLMGAMAFAGPDPDLCQPVLTGLAANGTWLTPTLTQSKGRMVPSSFDEDPRLRTVPPEVVTAWRESRGRGPEQEAQIGRPILDNMLAVVGMAHRAGVGILADLVLLDADPLEEIGNTRAIRAVVLDGRYLDRAALDGLLAEAERRAGSPPE